jgi:extracellular factor (EF) 3-hydroxypalmitic acid methyl ester biosynthesis protein
MSADSLGTGMANFGEMESERRTDGVTVGTVALSAEADEETIGELLEQLRHRLRPRRLPVGDVGMACAARVYHDTLGSLAAAVEDVSTQGVGLVVPKAADSSWFISDGDALDTVVVYCAGEPIYEGSARVRHATPQGEDLLIGIELDSGFIDIEALHRRRARLGFAERWKDFRERESESAAPGDFIEWIVDLHGFLDRTRTLLDAEEAALAAEDAPTREKTVQQYLEAAAPFVVVRLTEARANLAQLVKGVPENQLAEWRAFCRAQIGPILACSPIMRRAAEKPLGYAGDYEVMNMLYRGCAEGSSVFAKALSRYWGQEAAARANINGVEYLVGRMRAALESPRDERVRVVSIGCGPAREIFVLLQRWPELGPRLDITLVDQEERAVRYCERTLAPLAAATGARIRSIQAGIRPLVLSRGLGTALGECDLIYSAGLFDYLDDRCFAALLRGLYHALASGGTVVIGNVAADNPSRPAMEFFCDWFLMHRDAEELRTLAGGLKPAPGAVEVEAEPLGVNLFLTVSR